jgi:uncharacterized membrane-anchored protein YitT (DUF2179 family)
MKTCHWSRTYPGDQTDAAELPVPEKLRFQVTTVKASGMQGEVGIVFVIVNRKNQKQAISVIQQYNPGAFFTIENIHFVNRPVDRNILTDATGTGIFPYERH